jgi:hypothetical protein
MNREFCPKCHSEIDIYAEPRFCDSCGWIDGDDEEDSEEDSDEDEDEDD